MQPKRWFTLLEIQALMAANGNRVSIVTLERWCRQKRIPASKRLGGAWRVDGRSLKLSPDPEERDVYEELVFGMQALGR